MRRSSLRFHIARDHGFEFVFSSGPALTYPTHTHVSTFTVTLVRRGMVNVTRPSGRSQYGPGAVYIDAPHEPHSPAYGDNYEIVSLCVDKRRLSEMGECSLRALFLNYAGALADQGFLWSEDVAALLSGLGQIFSRPAELLSAMAEPQARLIGGPGLDEQELRAGSLRRFKMATGLTPHQFLIQNRIRTAKKLLSAEVSLSAAALEAGFYDQSHLNRWFRRNIGLTPKEYKKSCHFLISH